MLCFELNNLRNYHAKAIFLIGADETSYYLVNASIETIKCLKGQHDKYIGPHISSCILSTILTGSLATLLLEGAVISLLIEYT